MPTIEIMPRTETIAQLVQACASGRLPFDILCSRVAAMGYRTTSLYAMIRAAEAAGGSNGETDGDSPFDSPTDN